MKKMILIISMVFLLFCNLNAETVEYGFLTFEIPSGFTEAEPIYDTGFALKNGSLDPSNPNVGEGIYVSVSATEAIGETYMPQWESKEARRIATRETVLLDGLTAWKYTGTMPGDKPVKFNILYVPLSELETEREILFITLVNGDNPTQRMKIVDEILDSIRIKRPQTSELSELKGSSVS
jgi:hypothetical protein